MKFLRRYYSQSLFLLIGVLIGFFISRLPIEFEERISWISLATFFLTIILALYLEFAVRPSLTNTRNEKDILIDEIKEIKAKVQTVHAFYTENRSHNPLDLDIKTELLSKIRELSNQIDLVRKTDEYCKSFRRLSLSGRLFIAYVSYKKELTGRKFNEPAFIFDRLFWKEQDAAFRTLQRTCMECIIDINRAR